jgi:hypothetical protein
MDGIVRKSPKGARFLGRSQRDAIEPARQQGSGVRVLRTDAEIRTATERALVFEREQRRTSEDRSDRHQRTLERITHMPPQLVEEQAIPTPLVQLHDLRLVGSQPDAS